MSAPAPAAVDEVQLSTCLRISGIRIGRLPNFNALRLMDGLRRNVL